MGVLLCLCGRNLGKAEFDYWIILNGMATFIPQYKELIQGIAFGDNSGELNNTCSAVAMSIALNYLAARFDERLVPADMRLEPRMLHVRANASSSGADAACNGLHAVSDSMQSAGGSAQTTVASGAVRFHRYLIENCGIGPYYHFGRLTWGVWGSHLKRGFECYLAKLPVPPALRLDMHWRLGGRHHVMESIDRGIPALITTWPGRACDIDGNVYSWHTMVVYGYRVTECGRVEYCVHSGWLNSRVTRVSGTVCQDCIWLNSRAACMSYWFDVGQTYVSKSA